MKTVSTKPYLIRAIYEWCIDQGFSPHLVAQVDEQVSIPPGYARNGQIVLDVSPEATNHLLIGNEDITFQARFGGVAHSLLVPVSHVVAVYAGENGHGMAFEAEPGLSGNDGIAEDDEVQDGIPAESDGDDGDDSPPPASPGGRRSHLKVIK